MINEIQNALPSDIAIEIRNLFLAADYDQIKQYRRFKFSQEKDSKFLHTPNDDEVYTAEFSRSKFLETNIQIQNSYFNYLKPLIENYTNHKFSHHDLRCYRMDAGGHFRIHKDDYQSTFGFIWYLNKDWKWDWGGLLITLNTDSSPNVYIPEFNKLVILNHGDSQTPHFVTEIASHAKEPRLMLVGFLQ